MSHKIIAIEEEDLRICAELYVDVFNSEPWNDNWTVETAYKRLNDIYRTPNFIGLMYIENNALKGVMFGNCEQWYEGMHYNIKEMFVIKESQGKGIGSSILRKLVDIVKNKEVGDIILFTEKDKKTDVFYRNNGFDNLTSMTMMSKSI